MYDRANVLVVGGAGTEIYRPGISIPNPLLWGREYDCEWTDHAEVSDGCLLSFNNADHLQLRSALGITKHGGRLHLQFGALIGYKGFSVYVQQSDTWNMERQSRDSEPINHNVPPRSNK